MVEKAIKRQQMATKTERSWAHLHQLLVIGQEGMFHQLLYVRNHQVLLFVHKYLVAVTVQSLVASRPARTGSKGILVFLNQLLRSTTSKLLLKWRISLNCT